MWKRSLGQLHNSQCSQEGSIARRKTNGPITKGRRKFPKWPHKGRRCVMPRAVPQQRPHNKPTSNWTSQSYFWTCPLCRWIVPPQTQQKQFWSLGKGLCKQMAIEVNSCMYGSDSVSSPRCLFRILRASTLNTCLSLREASLSFW